MENKEDLMEYLLILIKGKLKYYTKKEIIGLIADYENDLISV